MDMTARTGSTISVKKVLAPRMAPDMIAAAQRILLMMDVRLHFFIGYSLYMEIVVD